MNIKQYLDSTYLKTAFQAGVSEEENNIIVQQSIQEAIQEGFKLIMIRPEQVSIARKMINEQKSKVLVGTVIDFPGGNGSLEDKIAEAEKAIANGADELDFVVDYEKFIAGDVDAVKQQVLVCTQLGLAHNKVVKWIIEIAALTDAQIIQLSALIKNVIIANFKEDQYDSVFVKSSTGFYKTTQGKPNGATPEGIVLMLENASPLPVKAAGGVRNFDEAIAMIKLGVKRIGTSAALAIVKHHNADGEY